MIISLGEAKEYLRVDFPEDDQLISGLLATAWNLTADVARLPDGKKEEIWNGRETNPSVDCLRGATLYALGYLYEHREEADHHALTLTLRSLLFAIREGVV